MVGKVTSYNQNAVSYASQLAEHVGEIRMLRDYHEVFFKLVGLVTDFVTPEGKIQQLCSARHFSRFCRFIHDDPRGKSACQSCGSKYLQLAIKNRAPVVYTCHAGLVDIIYPLFAGQQYIGCLTSGQFLNKKPTRSLFKKTAYRLRRLNLDERRLQRYYRELLVMDNAKIRLVVKLIGLIGNYVVETENKMLFLDKIGERDKISMARRHLESHYMEKITVADVARAVSLSPSHFSHLFKAQTGASFVQFLNRYRIQKAQELLRDSPLNITEIAFEAGFQNLSHFNRIFRKLTGGSPRDLRKAENV